MKRPDPIHAHCHVRPLDTWFAAMWYSEREGKVVILAPWNYAEMMSEASDFAAEPEVLAPEDDDGVVLLALSLDDIDRWETEAGLEQMFALQDIDDRMFRNAQ